MDINNKMWDVRQFRKYRSGIHILKKMTKISADNKAFLEFAAKNLGWLNTKQIYILDQLIKKHIKRYR